MKNKMNRLLVTVGLLSCISLATIGIWSGVRAGEIKSTTPEPYKIFVTGTGIVKAEPDIAFFDFSIVTQEEEAAASQQANNVLSNQVVQALLEKEIEKKDISTLSYSISPVYSYPSGKDPLLLGYRTVHQLSVKVAELSSLGDIIDVSMKAGVNQIQNIRFDIDNREDLLKNAIKVAVMDARAKAEIALNPENMGIVTLQEMNLLSSDSVMSSKHLMDSAPEGSRNLSVMPGTQSVQVQISAVYIFSDKWEEE